MFFKSVRSIALIFLLLTSFSCAEDFRGYSNDELGQQQTNTSDLPNFTSRLTNELLVAGEKCFGGEVVNSEGQAFTCQFSQWLITVDNVNDCTPEGCTEVFVPPVIGTLRRSSTQGGGTFFDILPAIPVSPEISSILGSVIVRFSVNEDPRVQFE
jgi:hypothetical protein